MIPGFHPDPSVVLVDGVYYLVTSTFEYLPALPIHRSSDLVTWEQIGNVATRPEQVALDHVPTPGGVWAPTIRYRDGVFYVIVTVFLGGRGCVVFTASDPAGPWSDGTPIPAVDGIDPDLAWGDDGTAYVTFARHPDAIRQVAVDLATGAALEEPRALWAGSGLYSPEGPHLYRRGAHWYLLVAEGGTDRGHAVSVARGPSPEGPWESCPDNPVLTASGSGSPIQNIGHADLVEGPRGSSLLVHLGVRPVGLAQAFSPLGRETFVSAVDWVDGWPRPRLPVLDPQPAESFGSLDLEDPGWLAVRRLPTSVGSVTGGRLVITADGTTLDDPRPWFVGRRQRHLRATVSTRVDASGGVGGLACRFAEDNWFALEASGATVTARARLAGLVQTWKTTVPEGDVELRLEMTPPPADFSAGAVGGDRIRLIAGDVVLAELDGRYWSFEVAKSFTGRVVGLYATDGTVSFADFHYRGGPT
ncbi:glycoside hydrolase family 43 protein [Cryptosporangium aurantiacum]|uniref:Beta-xylosidase n=1 Tax=Cryptosporangium aurantiacum TaxID=134849 RepID=A0A1M7RAE4_9ACTN|nr:glycoside hydrolase family 43 protein [Cryptosporangium aurantiacum]SHN43110.1 Beta-xylosidase [Cryptosporangium aurantiacum]